MRERVVVGALAMVMGCAAPGPTPEARPAESAQPSSAGAPPKATAAAGAGAAEAASAPPAEDTGGAALPQDGGAAAATPQQAPDAGAEADAAATFAADNKIKPPLASEELTARARGLFEAIVKNEPALADPFWFPKEPFIPLKDVKDPGKYWDNLHAAYVNDVKAMHRKRKGWEGARFVGFEVGSTPKWVPPGDEVNKIGYYRSFHGKLKYEIDGKPASLDVHTIISWQGRWYITHLGKFK
ncbi:hypothetical protein SOCE26_071020 [Sorangium cellulosum]|uniref:Uncharacterized protein n=1 Tax=Sorangium cellulosum TaxID=56 RepID=A0A2L0F233_SORCE|nr:hypothetical protein [Sorangium cellulosum]AUX45607.1 hypothetical protein SOCE26_071020 [Sorangium cellulosum]